MVSLQHAISQEALAYLQSQTDSQGRPLQVIKLPVPPPLHITKEEAQVDAHSLINMSEMKIIPFSECNSVTCIWFASPPALQLSIK